MKNRKLRVLLALALAIVLTLAIAFSFSASALITDAELTAGRAFEDGEGIQIGKDLDRMPQTYEAVVYVPSGVTEPGAILSRKLIYGGFKSIKLSGYTLPDIQKFC